MNSQTKGDRFITLIGIYQCIEPLLPLGFYKIEPPSGGVGTLWGFLVVSIYITFIAGVLLIFRYQIQSYVHVKLELLVIISGILSAIITILSRPILSPLTQTFIESFHQVMTGSGPITYLDVEFGGIFLYLSLGLGVLCILLGIIQYNHDQIESQTSKNE